MKTITMPDPAEVQALATKEEAVALLRRCTTETVNVTESLWSDRGDEPRRRFSATIFVSSSDCVCSGESRTISEAVAGALKAASTHDPLRDARKKLEAAGYVVTPF